MLGIPKNGIAASVNTHNCSLPNLCDWVEASLLFSDDEISRADVVDALTENQIYSSQDFAKEIVEQIWVILRNRFDYIKTPLDISVSANRISRRKKWTDFPAYGFCMSLACTQLYPSWAAPWASSKAGTYGNYFEELSSEAISAILSGWVVKKIGWTPKNPQKLRNIIDGLINDINERTASEIDLHVTSSAKELGLDIIAYRSHNDNYPACPVIMVQCAAGNNWSTKLKTPDLDLWHKVVSFIPHPVRGFTMPYAFTSTDEFRSKTVSMPGLFLERCRLLGAFGQNSKSVSTALNKKLLNWTKPLVAGLPSDNS